MPAPLQHSDIIFSSASQILHETLGELKKTNLSIKNRLKSIKQDSAFVCTVAEAYGSPLVANERCGSWYIPPDRKVGSAYFKSTDGHFGQWGLSLRRLNLQVFDTLQQHGGCVIVDSTRRGKSMPDALSKTVPIWIAVMNRLLFPEHLEAGELRTPLDVIGESEHAQIESRLNDSLAAIETLSLDVASLRTKLNGKPIQVCWQRPGETLPDSVDQANENLIVLCVASNQISNETSATSDYVQGAADDPEAWSLGLDAVTFWKHNDQLLSSSEDDLPPLIKSLLASSGAVARVNAPILIKPTAKLYVGTNTATAEMYKDFDLVISCATAPDNELAEALEDRYIVFDLPEGKNGSRLLRAELLKVDAMRSKFAGDSKILVTCHTGRDLAVGVALALLCTVFDNNGSLHETNTTPINKTMIKQRLSWIMVSMPDASPSRATLQSVNSYLMG
ncbi:putative tRNA A64-2'-O-ribosylphosphate transferase, rit1, DUSP-like domain-containing protein [Septoria linicola]|nr:putative tRNA A64-2'-O-ribosylphosphate transferase, rit1, DUSP-like domain-containing protein [Septoria linicola]